MLAEQYVRIWAIPTYAPIERPLEGGGCPGDMSGAEKWDNYRWITTTTSCELWILLLSASPDYSRVQQKLYMVLGPSIPPSRKICSHLFNSSPEGFRTTNSVNIPCSGSLRWMIYVFLMIIYSFILLLWLLHAECNTSCTCLMYIWRCMHVHAWCIQWSRSNCILSAFSWIKMQFEF